jgi:hypothetical protein
VGVRQEFRILLAERELARLKELRAAAERMDRVEASLEQIAESQERTQKMLDEWPVRVGRTEV